jgi:hypothetical protein
MTEERERELVSHLSSIDSLEELEAFRAAIIGGGEALSSGLLAEIAEKVLTLSKSKKGKR